jgi:hypothetical protein
MQKLETITESIGTLMANNSRLAGRVARLEVDNVALKADNAHLAGSVARLDVDNANLSTRLIHIEEDTHTLCINEGYIVVSHHPLRFLGRQNRQINQKARYMQDAYSNISPQKDPDAHSKAVELLTVGLGIINVSKHRAVVTQLDKILDRRNC